MDPELAPVLSRVPVEVPREVAAKLETGLAGWLHEGRRAVLVPAGNLAATLLAEGRLGALEILGLGDGDPGIQGSRLGAHAIHSLEALDPLGADLILVASTRFHLEITRSLQERFGEGGPRIVDLCEDILFHATLEGMAKSQGLELDTSQPNLLRVIRPGRPRKVVELDMRSFNFAPGLIMLFDALLDGEVPDHADEEEVLVRINRPKYRTFRDSGVTLFSPCQMDNEDNIMSLVRAAALKEGDHVVDLGAYSGDTTYFFSKAVGPGGRVLAVEPDPESHAALCRNIRELGLDNVVTDASAAWDQDGTVVFEPGGVTTSRVSDQQLEPASRAIKVPTATLETILARHGFSRVDFLKMDIEGAEFTVLPQARELLRRLRPRMILEVHGEQEGTRTVAHTLAFLEEAGFRAWPLDQNVGEYRALVQAEWQSQDCC